MRIVFLSLDNPEAAQMVAARLRKLIQGLAAMPNMGKAGRVFGTRELVTPKIGKTSYVVVYRVREDRLEILRILPGMRNIDSLLEGK
jgi:toxin ParE1/3/4